jgi:hypothetical protein
MPTTSPKSAWSKRADGILNEMDAGAKLCTNHGGQHFLVREGMSPEKVSQVHLQQLLKAGRVVERELWADDYKRCYDLVPQPRINRVVPESRTKPAYSRTRMRDPFKRSAF